MSEFSTRLKTLRLQKGLRQTEVAEEIGVSKGIVSLWENSLREPVLTSLVLLANFFNVSVDYLVGNSEITGA